MFKNIGVGEYKISIDGKFYNGDRRINPSYVTSRSGRKYMTYRYVQNGKRKSELVHRLVARMFLGDISAMEVNHKDHDVTNNAKDNLEIVTSKENAKARVTFYKNLKIVRYA